MVTFASGMGAVDTSRGRFTFMMGMLLFSFVAIEARLFFLQVRTHPDRLAEATERYFKDDEILAARGSILLRNDFPVAESVPAVRIWADSNWTSHQKDPAKTQQLRDAIASEIEEALGRRIDNLRAELDKPGYRLIATEALANGKPVKVVSDGESIKSLLEKKKNGKLPGIVIERTWVRSYPHDSVAANVLGYVDTEGRGQAGTELAFNSDLNGSNGRRTLARDGAGRPIFDVGCESVAAKPGADVHLTLDVVLQYYLEEALAKIVKDHKPKWVSGIVLDPKTGEILAMANLPTFDPNHYSNYDPENYNNRAIDCTYTPGSSFKPFMMSAVMEWSPFSLSQSIDCSSYVVDGRSIHDAHRHAKLTPPEIMAESSNIGMCRLVMRLCPESMTSHDKQLAVFSRVRNLLTDLGFGSRLEIGLPAESNGRLAGVAQWSRRYTLASLAFGHEIAVTPLQLAGAFSVFANEGVYVKPYIVDQVIGPDGTVLRRNVPESRRIYTKATVKKVLEMLVGVVDEGTGKSAQIDGYKVAGKTSTAQWENDGSKYTSSFAGFAPAYDPRLLVSIVVDQPTKGGHYGGTVAAPAAADVLARGLQYLRVPQDPE